MDYSFRPIKEEEIKYTYDQSQQLRGQTGSIGYLRADFGTSGKEFYTTWNEHSTRLKTDNFKSELDNVINELRFKDSGLLSSRDSILNYARSMPQSSFKGAFDTEYGFKIDTYKHTYLLRCNPKPSNYNLYCYCYVKDYLDKHIEKASRGIRFINSRYKELFRIKDGDSITITEPSGMKYDRKCRYIDEYHTQVGQNLFHICEFAERMEHNGNKYMPTEDAPSKVKKPTAMERWGA